MALYFDTSALVKLIIPEEGTEALETFINRADCGLWTSELSRTELMRACGLRVKMCVWLGVSRGLDLAFLNAD